MENSKHGKKFESWTDKKNNEKIRMVSFLSIVNMKKFW